jgi:iron complex transport system ATP-binding protein
VPEGEGLVLREVTAGYGGPPAIQAVSLEVEPGRITGLIGPNGAGKTTVVRVASRGLRPARGSIRVAGVDPYSVSARQAARLVAVVPQALSPVFSFTVLEMVMLGRSPYQGPLGAGSAADWRAVRWAMRAANVQHLADRPIDELSGGERQRVFLAQALAQDAPVLLLDEPTTHLDLRHVVEILSLVRGLARREGNAVLAIFHDLNLAAASCDRIVALSAGSVVADGRPSDVLTRSLVAEVFGVEAEVGTSDLTGRPSILVGPPPEAPRAPGRERVHVIGGAGRAGPLLRALAERGFDVRVAVLHAGDTDATVAEALNLLHVTVPPFSTIDDGTASECARMVAEADVLVVCDAPFGPGNVANLRVAVQAARAGLPLVVVEQIPIEERDFTARNEATELWRELRRYGAMATGMDQALERLAETSRRA